MIYAYISGALVLIFTGLSIYIKILKSKVETAEVKAQAAEVTAKSASLVVEQKVKTETVVAKVQEALNQKHVIAQARIDTHIPAARTDFDNDSF